MVKVDRNSLGHITDISTGQARLGNNVEAHNPGNTGSRR